MGALLAGGPLRPADPGAADGDPQPALGRRGGVDRRLDRLGLHHVRLDEAGALAQLGREGLALLGVHVGDRPRSRRARGAACEVASPSPDAPPATSAPVPSIFTGAEPYLATVSRSPSSTQAPVKESIATRLAEARERTLQLIEPLTDEQLNRVYTPLLSPLSWDLGHIANFEELWLVQNIGGREPMDGELGRLYDAIENPRAGRATSCRSSAGEELRSYMDGVRGRTLEVLEAIELER